MNVRASGYLNTAYTVHAKERPSIELAVRLQVGRTTWNRELEMTSADICLWCCIDAVNKWDTRDKPAEQEPMPSGRFGINRMAIEQTRSVGQSSEELRLTIREMIDRAILVPRAD